MIKIEVYSYYDPSRSLMCWTSVPAPFSPVKLKTVLAEIQSLTKIGFSIGDHSPVLLCNDRETVECSLNDFTNRLIPLKIIKVFITSNEVGPVRGTELILYTMADYLVDVFIANGVSHVFGYPGSPIVPFLDAIERRRELNFVLFRHEGGAAYAASAVAKRTKKLTVCLSTSGPGAANLLTGIADAYQDNASVLFITGSIASHFQQRYDFQDLNQTAIFSQIGLMSLNAWHPDQFPSHLRNTMSEIINRSVPAHLSISQNVFVAPQSKMPIVPYSKVNSFASDKDIEIAQRLIASRDQPVFVIGSNISSEEQPILFDLLSQICKVCGIPVVTTLDAKGLVNEGINVSLGVVGIFGYPAVLPAYNLIKDSNLVIGIGMDDVGLSMFLTNIHTGKQVRDVLVIEEFPPKCKAFHMAYHLVGNIVSILRNIKICHVKKEWTGQAIVTKHALEMEIKSNKMEGLFSALNELSMNSTVCLDVGLNTVWAARLLKFTSYSRVITSNRMGAMGWSLPSCIGIKLDNPKNNVVGIAGDGGFQMTINELATAVENSLKFLFVVFQNGELQNVKIQQTGTGQSTTFKRNPDLYEIVLAYGAIAKKIDIELAKDAYYQTLICDYYTSGNKPTVWIVKSKVPSSDIPFAKFDLPEKG